MNAACVTEYPSFMYKSWYTLGPEDTFEATYHEVREERQRQIERERERER